jgi:hypothetical protein
VPVLPRPLEETAHAQEAPDKVLGRFSQDSYTVKLYRTVFGIVPGVPNS